MAEKLVNVLWGIVVKTNAEEGEGEDLTPIETEIAKVDVVRAAMLYHGRNGDETNLIDAQRVVEGAARRMTAPPPALLDRLSKEEAQDHPKVPKVPMHLLGMSGSSKNRASKPEEKKPTNGNKKKARR